MLTSPRTNATDNFVPSHHLALITQPVLGARSRSRKKTNIILETATSTKKKLDAMASSRRSSYNDSPPLILPINRVDTSQYQKKNNFTTYHDSSDSGLDLSLSTNSSVQFQQYSQPHFQNHRPLSALNEDSSPDDGYHGDDPQVSIDIVRLRCPPVSFGRNRSMEDMISNNTHDEQQHRSSSFSDERQQKLLLQHENKMKRSSDGALLDLVETSTKSSDSYRRINATKNDLLYPLNTQQHRSLNDLTNKTSSKVTRNESNMPAIMNNLSTTHTIIRKPNASILKQSRKKTKLNIPLEPSVPLTSSRLTVYDEQINTMTGTTSSSSNQTTPRSIRPLGHHQQHVKSKATTQLSHYPNQEQIRAHVNRSVIERQHPTHLVAPTRRGFIQQIIPFDASPSKVNNLLLRHCVQQHQSNIIYHPNSNTQSSPSRQIKQTLRTLYNEETISNNQDEKRKQKEHIKIKKLREYDDKRYLKQKEDFENNPSYQIQLKEQRRKKIKDINESITCTNIHQRENSHDTFDQPITQRYFIGSLQKQKEYELSSEKNHERNKFVKYRLSDGNQHIDRREYTENIRSTIPDRHFDHQNENHIQRLFDNEPNRYSTIERYESGQSNNIMNKSHNANNVKRRQQRNVVCVDDSIYINQSNSINQGNSGNDQAYGSNQTVIVRQNKTQNSIDEKNLNQSTELISQYGPDNLYAENNKCIVAPKSRPSKVHFQSYENPLLFHPLSEMQTDRNRRQNSSYENDEYTWRKSQTVSISKAQRTQTILPNDANTSELKHEREKSQLSNVSKQDDETKFNRKTNEKHSNGSFQTKSPTPWSIISKHQDDQQINENYEKSNIYQHKVSKLPSSNEEFAQHNDCTHSRTHHVRNNDEQQLLDGRYVIPSNSLHTPPIIDRSSHPSPSHTYPFTCTNDIENNNNNNNNNGIFIDDYSESMKNKNYTAKEHEIDVLSDSDHTQSSIEHHNSPPCLRNVSPNKKVYSPQDEVIVSTEKEETTSNYDSDDGWSDDSAELLYVDERYASVKKNITRSSHMSSQQSNHNEVQH